MFAFLELPQTFDETRNAFADLSDKVIEKLHEHCEEKLIRSDEDFDEIIKEAKGVYWITEGSLVMTSQSKRIVAFEAGECFALDSLAGEGPFTILNELAVRVGFVSLSDLAQLFVKDSELATAYVSLQSVYSQILSEMLSMSPLLENPFDPSLMNVDAETVLIQEGDEGDEIYTLVKGELEVSVKGVVVGTVQEGEIFGVIAAFTESARTATVTSKTESLVMKLPKVEFESLVKQRPSLVAHLVESMSRTIGELNERVIKSQVPD